MTARDLLRRRYLEQLQELAGEESDYREQIKVGYMAPTGMEGGFGQDEQSRLRREAAEYRAGMQKEYTLQDQYLKQSEDEAKKAARKAKLGGLLKAGGTILGAALAVPTMGASLGITGALSAGAALGGTLGEVGNTLYGTGAAPSIDLSFLGDFERWNKYREARKAAKAKNIYDFEHREPPAPLEDY